MSTIMNQNVSEKFKIAFTGIIKRLENNFPHFDDKEFFMLFRTRFQAKLSKTGKNIDPAGLEDAIKSAHAKFTEELKKHYGESLVIARKYLLENFDQNRSVQLAKTALKEKLNPSKRTLLETLTKDLTTKGLTFTDKDKEELDKQVNQYAVQCEEKLNHLLQEIELVWSKVAQLQLAIRQNQENLQARDPQITFSVNETDLDKLSIGIAPDPNTGWKIDIDNLVERLMHKLANQKPGEKFHVMLNVPDRIGIIRQIGDIGFQCRSPAVALLALLIFYLLAVRHNNDVKRMVTAFEKIINEKEILIDPKDINYTIKQLDNNGKSPVVIKKQVSLSPEDTIRLQQANQILKENLKKGLLNLKQEYPIEKKIESFGPTYQPDAGYGSESEEPTQEKNFSPRLGL